MQQILFTENNDGAASANLNRAPRSFESFVDADRQTFGAGEKRKSFFAEKNEGKKPFCASASENNSSQTAASRLFPLRDTGKNKPKQLFAILLAYLDQIVYLDELSENLEQLDLAINTKNTGEVNRIARDCAAASLNCGLFAAVKPLRELERIQYEYELANAALLSCQIGEECEQFRFTLKENMQQMAIAK